MEAVVEALLAGDDQADEAMAHLDRLHREWGRRHRVASPLLCTCAICSASFGALEA